MEEERREGQSQQLPKVTSDFTSAVSSQLTSFARYFPSFQIFMTDPRVNLWVNF